MPNQLPAYNIDAICLDAGRLTTALILTESHKKLKEIASLVGELYDLDFEQVLTPSEQNRIKAIEKTVENFLNRIKDFQAGRNFDVNGKNQIDREIDNFYNSESKELRIPLIFLRQQAQKNISSGQLSTAIADNKKIQDELRSELQKVVEIRNKIAHETTKIDEGLATYFLSKEFAKQADDCHSSARIWLMVGTGLLLILLAVLISGAVWLFSHYDLMDDNHLRLQIELGVAFLAVVSILFYGAKFSLGNFSIYTHTEMVNRHRRDVAGTIENFIGAGINDAEMKQQLLKEAAVAMFSRDTTGFLGRNDGAPTLPTVDVINNIGKTI